MPSSVTPQTVTITGIEMVRLLGTQDRLMTRLQREYPRVSVHVRGNEITLTSDATSAGDAEVERAQLLIAELVQMVRDGIDLTEGDVTRGANRAPAEKAGIGEVILSSRGKTIRAKTAGQQRYVQSIRENTIVFGIGPAGTGKTYLAMAMAVAALQRKEVNRIILTRPAVEAGERLGFAGSQSRRRERREDGRGGQQPWCLCRQASQRSPARPVGRIGARARRERTRARVCAPGKRSPAPT